MQLVDSPLVPMATGVTLIGPALEPNERNHIVPYTAPAGTTLDSETDYYILIERNSNCWPDSCFPGVGTADSSQGSSGQAGWSMHGHLWIRQHNTQSFLPEAVTPWPQDARWPWKAGRGVLQIGVRGSARTGEQQVVDPPTIEGAPRLSGAGDDGAWSEGETVRVALAFSEAVDVDTTDGKPSLEIELSGTAARSALYENGSGTAELVFAYTLVEGDGTHAVTAVTPNSLVLNAGTIRSVASATHAALEHVGTVAQGIHARGAAGPGVTFHNAPQSHDGENAFKVQVRFSGRPAGLVAKRDGASVVEVTGGTVSKARTVGRGSNPPWELTIAPAGAGAVTVRVPARACTERYAVCIDGRPLAQAAETTVSGPVPVVSIAPAATPVTEGTAAAFTLARTGATDAALTVAVSVSQAGDVLSGAAPTEAVFAANASQARLAVATDDDGAHEPDARITASLVAGEGYRVDAAGASAVVDVFDDDAPGPAPSPGDVWSSTLTWTVNGNGWLIANAQDFSNPDWTEDGRATASGTSRTARGSASCGWPVRIRAAATSRSPDSSRCTWAGSPSTRAR